MKIILGTRGSALARWQADNVQAKLQAAGAEVELRIIETEGDRVRDRAFRDMTGKGFFTKEIERALLAREIDVAVHSLKDLPSQQAPGLEIAALPEREAADDVLLVRAGQEGGGPVPLRRGAKVGTSSVRRQRQLAALRPDLELVDLRGNVPTRVDKVRRGDVDAAVLAWAGVHRLQLDLAGLAVTRLGEDVMVPAPAQGALGVQVRRGDPVAAVVRRIHAPEVETAVSAERALLSLLEGGCRLPLGVRAKVVANGIDVLAVFARDDVPLQRVHVVGSDPLDAAYRAYVQLGGVAVADLSGRTVAVTRDADELGALGVLLRARGAEVIAYPVLETHACIAPAELAAGLDGAAWLAFTSANAVRHVAEVLASGGRAIGELSRARIAAVGEATAEALRDLGLAVAVVPSERSGAGLARALAPLLRPNERVVVIAARDGRRELSAGLQGADVQVLVAYETRARALPPLPARVHQVLLTSPSAAEAVVRAGWPAGATAVAMGETTAEAARALGLTVLGHANGRLVELARCLP